MKKYILFLIVSVFVFNTFAQDSEEKDQPVSSTFESGYLIDNQTIFIPDARTLEFVIQHKFGTMDQGFSDLFGIYAPGSNIRLGLNYVLVNNLQIGIGVTKKNMYTDFNAKWTILKQTEKNTIPVSVALFGSFAIDGRNSSEFGSGKIVESKFPSLPIYISLTDRFSYFSQLIIGRKFADWLSLQVGASYTHYNMVKWNESHRNIFTKGQYTTIGGGTIRNNLTGINCLTDLDQWFLINTRTLIQTFKFAQFIFIITDNNKI